MSEIIMETKRLNGNGQGREIDMGKELYSAYNIYLYENVLV